MHDLLSFCMFYVYWSEKWKNANIHMLSHQKNADHLFSQIILCLDDFAKIWELSLHSLSRWNELTQQRRKIKLLLSIFYPFDIYFQCPSFHHLLQSDSYSITTEMLPSKKNNPFICLCSRHGWSQRGSFSELGRFYQVLYHLWMRTETLLQCFEGLTLLMKCFRV